eukprot:PhF_6_TR25172/c0_g2_i5/m.34705
MLLEWINRSGIFPLFCNKSRWFLHVISPLLPKKKSQVSFVIMMNDHPCGLLGTDSTTNTWDVYTGGWWELTGSNASFTFTSFCRTEVSSQFTVGLQVVTGTTGGAWTYENCQYSARVKTMGSNDANPIQSSIALLSTGRDGVSQSIVTTPSFSSVQGTYKKFSLNSPAFLDIFAICKFQPLSDLDPSNNFANAAEFAIALNDKICTLNGTAETKGRIPGTGLLSTLSARTSEQRGVFEVETICRQQVDSDFHLTIQARLLNFPQYNIIGCKYNVLQHPIYKGVKYQSQVVLPGTLTVSERSWMNLGNAVFPYAPGTRNLEVTALCDLRPLSNADHRSSQNQGAFRITINGEPCTLSGTKTDDINDNPTISSRANFGVSSITLHALCRKQILNDWLNVSWMNISLQGIDNSIPSKSWNYSSCAIGVRTEESPVLSTFVAARGLNTTIVPPNTSMNVAGMEKVITIPHGTKFTQQVEVMASCVAYPPQQLSQTSFAIMINGFPCGLLGLQSTSGGDWVSLWDIAVGSVTMTKICRTEVSSQVTVGLQVVTGTGGTWKFDNCQYNARVTNASCDSIPECKDMPPTTTAPSSTATITPPKVSSTPTCPPGWIIPGSGCIQCSVLDHCNNNSLSVTSDDERTKCVCRCKPSFVGPTCGQCSLGREDYPKCSCNKTALDCGSHCVDPLNVCSITGECDVWSHTCDWPSLDITLQMDWNAWTVQNTTAFISLIVKNMTSSVMTYPGNDIRVTARSGSVILTVALATLEQLKDFQNNVTTLVATGDLAGYGSVAIQLPHAGPVDVQTLSDNNTFAYLALIILFVPLLVFLHYCRARRAADKMKALANEMSTTTNMETLYREATVLYNSYANCKFWTKTIAELRRHYERILIAILAHSADSYLYKEMCYAMRMNDE